MNGYTRFSSQKWQICLWRLFVNNEKRSYLTDTKNYRLGMVHVLYFHSRRNERAGEHSLNSPLRLWEAKSQADFYHTGQKHWVSQAKSCKIFAKNETSSSVPLNAKQIMLQCQSIINFVLAYTEWIFISYPQSINISCILMTEIASTKCGLTETIDRSYIVILFSVVFVFLLEILNIIF